MKQLFLSLLCVSSCTILLGQAPGIKITEKTIVKDADGAVYPYSVWRNLVMQGDYDMQPADPKNEKTRFVLVKLTEQEKVERMEKMAKPRESESFQTGKEFSFFKTSDINNNKIDLKQEKGKIIVINFWFINCPPCRMEIPALNELVESYKGNDSVRFIAIALDEKASIKNFLKTFPFNYDIIDNGRFLSDKYGVRGFPTHVIINQEGRVYFHTAGLARNTVYWLKKSINELITRSALAQQ